MARHHASKPYPKDIERIVIAGLGKAERERQRQLCSSTRGKWHWLGIDLCARRKGFREDREKPPSLDGAVAVHAFIKEFLPSLQSLQKEKFIVVPVDSKMVPIGVADIATGSLNATLVHPREVLQIVLLLPASGFFVLHNHPSGDPQPSDQDIELTGRLANGANIVGVRLIDHVIVGRDDYYSFAEAMAHTLAPGGMR